MALYKRGDVWWFKFRFEGQVIASRQKLTRKQSRATRSAARRRELELGVNGLTKRERPLFPRGGKAMARRKAALSPLGSPVLQPVRRQTLAPFRETV